MELEECIQKRTSVRRFTQESIDIEHLKKIIDLVRISPSAANLQPLEYIIINKSKICNDLFPHIGWAGYIKPPWYPDIHERPKAYIAILNTQLKNPFVSYDVGISMAYIALIAQSLDIGSCILCKINKIKINEILKIPKNIELKALIALGTKDEIVTREKNDDDVKYWRDENEIFHVPKKSLSKILHLQYY